MKTGYNKNYMSIAIATAYSSKSLGGILKQHYDYESLYKRITRI